MLPADVRDLHADAKGHATEVEEGDDRELEEDDLAAGAGPTAFDRCGGAALEVGALDVGAQLEGPVGELEILQRTADVPRAQPEHRPQPLIGVDDVPVAVDHQLRHGADIARGLTQVAGGVVLVRGREGQVPPLRLALGLDEEAPFHVHRLERGALGQQRLGLAQE